MGTRPRNRNQLRLAWIAALLTLICLLPGNAFGIDGGRPLSQLRLDTWSVRDGLPSRAITAIAQTPDGFLWLGTAAGLIRFDGISFDTYDTQNTPSLPGNMITVLTVTHDGKLWVGTEWGGFGQFADGKFLPAVPPDKHWSKITAIVEDTDGSLWVGGWGDAPVRHLVQGRLISYKNLQTPDPGVNAILPLGHGSVLCGMPWDTPRQLLPNGKIAKIWPALNISQTCSCLCQGNDGAIWWGNSQNGLYEIKGRQVRHFTTQDGLASNVVSSLYKDPSGNIWVGTTNGLSVWNGSLFQSFSKDGGLYDSAVGPILDDLEGNLWVAAGVGLNRFAATKLQPYTINRGGDTATLSDQCSLSPSPRGGMWCATNKGLWLLNARAQIFCDLGKHIDSHLAGVIGGPDGNLWVWNNDPGKPYTLLCISPKSGKGSQSVETALTAAARDSLQYHGLVISSSLFAAIPTKGGLIGFAKNKILRFAPGRLVSSQKFPGTFEFTAKQDRTGTIWVGDITGFIRYKDGIATVMDAGLPKDTHVLDIDTNDPNCLWLATDHGLAKFQNGRSTLIGREAGLPDTNLFQILRDRDGRLWFGSNFGIFNIRLRDLEDYCRKRRTTIPYVSYAASDGIRSFPTTFNGQKSSDGRLWFGGNKGVTVADPRSRFINPVAPPVSIEKATLDRISLTSTSANSVQPGQGFLSIRYAALSFAAPEKVQFRYKLEGLDDRWTDAGNRRVAIYPYLPPGRYRFVVIACNNDGVWNMNGASMSFVLQPHYYQTTWFKLLCAAGLILLLGLVYSIRVRAMVLRNRELAVKVAERTAELQVSNEQLSAAQDALGQQYSLLEDRNHELEAMQIELETHNEELRSMQASLAEANAHLAALATTDGLTGLKNHRTFQEQLEVEWERYLRYDGSLSLVLLDIDLFKQYNDKFGHQAGDDVLKKVAAILAEQARDCDLVARYGGEEFVIILPQTDRAGAVSHAERICMAIRDAKSLRRPITASFGVATADSSISSSSDLFTRADSALFYSKEHGRDQVTHAADLPVKSLRKAS